MDIKSFEVIVKSEKSARRFLLKACWKNYRRFCIACKSRKVYRIRRQRYRCKQCGYEFSDFSGRWIGKLNISCRDWLWLIKLFELELSSRKIGHTAWAQLSYCFKGSEYNTHVYTGS